MIKKLHVFLISSSNHPSPLCPYPPAVAPYRTYPLGSNVVRAQVVRSRGPVVAPVEEAPQVGAGTLPEVGRGLEELREKDDGSICDDTRNRVSQRSTTKLTEQQNFSPSSPPPSSLLLRCTPSRPSSRIFAGRKGRESHARDKGVVAPVDARVAGLGAVVRDGGCLRGCVLGDAGAERDEGDCGGTRSSGRSGKSRERSGSTRDAGDRGRRF